MNGMSSALVLVAAAFLAVGVVVGQEAETPLMGPPENSWVTIHREGAVNLDEAYDTSGLTIPRFQVHEMLAQDAIPALTDPETVALKDAAWLEDGDRLIYVERGDDAIAVPIRVINWHEAMNVTLDGQPIAITYCPLCDSVTVLSREVVTPGGERRVLEFGVTGALYNSNVLLYDRETKSLWSQLGLEAVSGAMVGTRLDLLPFRMLRTPELRAEASEETPVVTPEATGYERQYESSPYDQYFMQPGLVVPVWFIDNRLPAKTLGLGIATEMQTWCVVAADLRDRVATVETDRGPVRVTISTAGMDVLEAPEGVDVAQTHFYAWAAFHRATRIVRLEEADADGADEGAGG